MTITYQLSFIDVSLYISCHQVFDCNIKNTVTLKTHVGFRLMAIDRFDKNKLCINKVYKFNFEFQCDRSSPNFFWISIQTRQTKSVMTIVTHKDANIRSTISCKPYVDEHHRSLASESFISSSVITRWTSKVKHNGGTRIIQNKFHWQPKMYNLTAAIWSKSCMSSSRAALWTKNVSSINKPTITDIEQNILFHDQGSKCARVQPRQLQTYSGPGSYILGPSS